MVEAIIYFALGFLVAATLALTALPAVWNRAARLTRRRVEHLSPVSLAEIAADRDQLRAEFAMANCRLELELERLRLRDGELRAEIGRQQDALALANARLTTLDAREKEVVELQEKLASADTAMTAQVAALQESQAKHLDKDQSIAGLQRSVDDTVVQFYSRNIEIAALEAKKVALEDRLADLRSQIAAANAETARERDGAAALRKSLEDATTAAAAEAASAAQRIAELEEAVRARTQDAQAVRERLATLASERIEQERRLRDGEEAVAASRQAESQSRDELARADDALLRENIAASGPPRSLGSPPSWRARPPPVIGLVTEPAGSRRAAMQPPGLAATIAERIRALQGPASENLSDVSACNDLQQRQFADRRIFVPIEK